MSKRILVTGARGFIGSAICATLEAKGYSVLRGARQQKSDSRMDTIAIDFANDNSVATWNERLTINSIDCVVNCAGILRENGTNTFNRIHVETPAALYAACAQTGIKKIIQISALGDPCDGEFIASKYRGDNILMGSECDWVIIRPSVVYSAIGSYGGTSLLRAMAAIPGLLCLPGNGLQSLQPIALADLAEMVANAATTSTHNRHIVEAVGPTVVTLQDYVLSLRRWMGVSSEIVIHVPLLLTKWLCLVGEQLGSGPLGMTMFAMLQRGNVGNLNAAKVVTALLNRPPQSIAYHLRQHPAQSQDIWHARTYLLIPAMRYIIALVWLLSGCAGFAALNQLPTDADVVSRYFLQTFPSVVVLTSVLDIILGIGICWKRWRTHAAGLMLISVISYTGILGVLFPALWLEPLGGLIKNLPLIPVLMLLLALDKER